jgi:DNA-binding SARP family transcriptional activator
VEIAVEMDEPAGDGSALELRLLGPMSVRRAGRSVALPASRKVRALLAYLALATQPVARSQLCELLWTVPNDPRGELRWCLSKLRSVIDEPGRPRIQAHDDRIRLELADCDVDALAVSRATAAEAHQQGPLRRRLRRRT